ncbi:MAG: selenide, water dikinase SelD [Geobacteraceae bacterium GWC2_58_44]|nr:MAG: selenide, water dikinase SelD [Geobacteraceae bacterium GWC2_58_44]
MGVEGAEDAGIYRIGESLALVETTDIITPLVDDPFTFGRIAAANALSDVYAMGGRPVTAMNLAFFPACSLPTSVLAAILAGGADALREAGACLVGGHTVEDDELKFGLAVTGLIDPARIVRNCTARPGDLLVLTKPLGTGIVSTAIKAEMVAPALEAEAIRWMTQLNSAAAQLMVACAATAATDVTGFGFIGHACEMALGAGVSFRIELSRVPVMAGVAALVDDGLVPAGCYRNREHYAALVSGIGGDILLPLFDPQTSGGLLIALAPADAGEFLSRSEAAGAFALCIGGVEPKGGTPIVFV